MSRKKTLGVSLAAAAAIAILIAAYTLATPALTPVASKEGVVVKGIVDIVVKDANGNVKYQATYHNDITHDGYEKLLTYVFDQPNDASKVFKDIRVYQDAGTTESANIQQGTPSVTISDLSDTGGKATISEMFTATGSALVTYLKLMDTQSPPVVFSVQDISDINLSSGDTLTVSWTIAVSGT